MTAEGITIQHADQGFVRSFILLRWTLIILGAYLTFFAYLESPMFGSVVGFITLFAATNVVFSLLPLRYFRRPVFQS
jgi:predicted signal transduction protein with EAL and GGDEF domain